MAFPPPPVTLRQRSSTCVEPHCSLRRVLSKGYHSFLSKWFEKVSQPSLAEPFGSDVGVTRINSRLSLLSPGLHNPFAVPLSVSKAVTFVTGCLYAYLRFRSNFCVFYFLSFRKICLTQQYLSKLAAHVHYKEMSGHGDWSEKTWSYLI